MKLSTVAISTAALLALFAGLTYFSSQPAVGSVIMGGEYDATVLDSSGTSTVRTLFGSVGSVVITESATAGAQPIRIFDTSSTTVATSTLTAKLEIYGDATEGTYTFDVAFGSGILVDVPTDFDGSAVLTTR